MDKRELESLLKVKKKIILDDMVLTYEHNNIVFQTRDTKDDMKFLLNDNTILRFTEKDKLKLDTEYFKLKDEEIEKSNKFKLKFW